MRLFLRLFDFIFTEIKNKSKN